MLTEFTEVNIRETGIIGVMRPRVSWMTHADDTILEFFDNHQIALPPTPVSFNIGFSETHVRNRMRKLADEGLLSKVDEKKGYYEITEKGQSYLSGELEASDLERTE